MKDASANQSMLAPPLEAVTPAALRVRTSPILRVVDGGTAGIWLLQRLARALSSFVVGILDIKEEAKPKDRGLAKLQ